MKNFNSDRFEISSNNPKQQTEFLDSSNFFLSEDIPKINNKSFNSEPSRRLNDYDFNLLKEDAYKDVSDDVFKLEYKIQLLDIPAILN